MVLGVKIEVVAGSSASALIDPNAVRDIYVLGHSSGGNAENHNTPVLLSGISDIPSGASDTLTHALYGIFAVTGNSARVYFVQAIDTNASGSDEAKKLAHLTAAKNALLDNRSNYIQPGILLYPEFSLMITQDPTENINEKTKVFQALDELCKKKSWLLFINSSAGSASDAIKEAQVYNSSKFGNSAFYYGKATYPDPDDSQKTLSIPLASLAAATVIVATGLEGIAQPPAGVSYPLTGASSITGLISLETEYTALQLAKVNFVTQVKNAGYCFWGSRTLATDSKFQFINTRLVLNAIVEELRNTMARFIQEPLDPRGQTTASLLAATTSVMQDAYNAGMLSGRNIQEAYSVSIKESSSLYEIVMEIKVRPVYTVESITVSVINETVIAI
ncbi:hypothetical protein [Moorena sp. SIO3A2]|uniref:hypothetical protein n=1 Tax=Moorena sp. SIO3A2 TaxID=2607841 RepID=UPI0013BB2595|nr:hypothetical protein [Moorena sp. SIO3A2]NER90348.1 hypothetical protein [Moorena sp. SIO3A2]